MPQNRQVHLVEVAEADILVRSLGLLLPRDQRIEAHQHDWHQLVYATEGAMRVDSRTESWFVPPDRAVWMPAGFEHAIQMTGRVRMQTVYLRPGLSQHPSLHCGVIAVSPLLRELVLETLQRGMLLRTIPEQARLAAVLIDQVVRPCEASLQIRLPRDARARTVARKVQADLSMVQPIGQLVQECGASVRTIERLFVQETGLSFGRWLQRIRALHAIERLGAGDSVTDAALAVGYDSTSAFIAMFKRVLGKTPGSYCRDQANRSAT